MSIQKKRDITEKDEDKPSKSNQDAFIKTKEHEKEESKRRQD